MTKEQDAEIRRLLDAAIDNMDQGAIPDAEIFDDDTTRIVVHAQAAMHPSEYKNGGGQ
jgi:hypothetical protein